MGTSVILGVIIGVVCGGGGVLLIGLLQPRKFCPDCGKPLPKFRRPSSVKQSLWGGNTCPKCGCQINRKGEKVVKKS